MDDLIELAAPGGVDEANHGTERYRVDNDGRVRVPREAAYWLIRAGFRPVPALAARDVAPGERWVFDEHRTMAEVIAQETTAPNRESGDGADDNADLRLVPRRSK